MYRKCFVKCFLQKTPSMKYNAMETFFLDLTDTTKTPLLKGNKDILHLTDSMISIRDNNYSKNLILSVSGVKYIN